MLDLCMLALQHRQGNVEQRLSVTKSMEILQIIYNKCREAALPGQTSYGKLLNKAVWVSLRIFTL